MEAILQKLACLDASRSEQRIALLAALIDKLRPARRESSQSVVEKLRALSYVIGHQPELRLGLQRSLRALFVNRPSGSLLTLSGILPSTGFFTEASRRIGHALLPETIDSSQLRGVLRVLFPYKHDAIWVREVDDCHWVSFLVELFPLDHTPPSAETNCDLIEAMRTVSYWIAAAGLEPELVRLEPALTRYESPFVAQNLETLACLETIGAGQHCDMAHLRVLLAQCHAWLDRIRKQSMRFGTSVALTFRVRRLRQLLKRLQRLADAQLAMLTPINTGRDWQPLITLFKRLVKSECLRNDLGTYWRQHMSLLALRITENAGRTGEHYITSDRQEYFTLVKSALGAGVIIACMALCKTLLTKLHLAPLNESLAICLNYGLGFVLIHLLHGTVATKQPAMTANAIALSLGGSKGHLGDLDQLVELIARTCRSQIAAIFGNIAMAVPTAIAIGTLLVFFTGETPFDASKSAHLLADVHPFGSLALVYAAIAGICLFLAGLISGYFDNLAAYDDIPARVEQLPWARRLFGEARMRRVAGYIGDNLGALAGNFFFGFLLGGAWTIGVLFGLPLDIRHVAFSSANLGFALAGSQFEPNWALFAWAAAGVLLIGAVNLIVSFALALNVALRSRGIAVSGKPRLLPVLWRQFKSAPRRFLLPPKRGE